MTPALPSTRSSPLQPPYGRSSARFLPEVATYGQIVNPGSQIWILGYMLGTCRVEGLGGLP
jgi:hypothetical protein